MSSTLGRGFQLFKKENIWKHFDWTFGQTGSRINWHLSHLLGTKIVRTFFAEKQQILFHRTLTYSEIDAVPESEDLCQGTLHFEKDDYKVIRWIFLLNSLYGWDFSSPHKCTRTRSVPFEAVMCTVGAASQISWMLTEDICFWYKISLESPQEFNQTRYGGTYVCA